MARLLKEYVARDLARKVSPESGFVAVQCNALNAAETFELRKLLREAGGTMTVVPNRLALRVVKPFLPEAGGNGHATLVQSMFRGPTALVVGNDPGVDCVVRFAKAIVEWRKKHADKLDVKGGYLLGQVLDEARVLDLANLPDEKTLQSQVAYLFQTPLRQMATVTEQIITRVVWALNDYKDKLEKTGGAA